MINISIVLKKVRNAQPKKEQSTNSIYVIPVSMKTVTNSATIIIRVQKGRKGHGFHQRTMQSKDVTCAPVPGHDAVLDARVCA